MGPSREACDRCHAMKTRCVRQLNSQTCHRCNRLGIACNYSPPGRTGRPIGSRKLGTHGRSIKGRSDGHAENLVSTTGPVRGEDDGDGDDDEQSTALLGWEPASSIESFDFSLPNPPSEIQSNPFAFLETHSSNLGGKMSGYVEPCGIPTPPSSDLSLNSPMPNANRILTGAGGCGGSNTMSGRMQIPVKEDIWLQLSDIQARLAKLIRCLKGGSHTVEDVEEIYRTSEAFTGILDAAACDAASQSPLAAFDGTVALLLSSCYLTLIKSYRFLINMLQQELHNTSTGDMQDKMNGTDVKGLLRSMLPQLSVGGVRLAMSGKAMAEINLHVVEQKFQHLKCSTRKYALREAAAQNRSRENSEAPREPWESPDSSPTTSSALVEFVETALIDMRCQEEDLLVRLHSAYPLYCGGQLGDT
ncbi:hypothetical protein GGR57DRAFT_467800 [Xylariaceae sp. FL1272]|nr:hypothetical protein GGR57DRAFT_467800 [Xylariaceae sp. FL1272]